MINIKTATPVGAGTRLGKKHITRLYYICECCGEKKYFNRLSKFSRRKNKYGMMCQKCATKKNAQSEGLKEKERRATAEGWKNGRYDHLRENGYFLDWGRRYCKNILEKTPEEKEKIAAKKIKTWCNHTEEEKKEINQKRTEHFKEHLNQKNIKKPLLWEERFRSLEWRKMRLEVIRRDQFTCQKCKRILPKSRLDVHHIVPYRLCKENKEENLIALCRNCHGKVERFLEKECLSEDGGSVDIEKEKKFIFEE